MTSGCNHEISDHARTECARLRISPRCAYCVCKFVMHGRERARRSRFKKGQGQHSNRVLSLVKKLTPYQMELFERWKRACVAVGVEMTPSEKLSWLSDVTGRRAA